MCVPRVWGEKITTIKQIKQLIKKLPYLGISDSSVFFIVETDGSESGYERILKQKIQKNKLSDIILESGMHYNKNILLLKEKSFLLFYV